MEVNKEEALKCLEIARSHLGSGNITSALKFCNKSISLYPTPEARSLLQAINNRNASSGTSTSAEPGPSPSSTRNRHPGSAEASSPSSSSKPNGPTTSEKSYTPEQVTLVKRVRSCKVTAYYEILELSSECEEGDIKKAYKKLALQLHPDKNGAPGADEAFKMVSKAFQVLSDPQKRSVFDANPGTDPESRFGAGGGGGGATSPFARGGGFEGELSPEDLFNAFFGGGFANGGGFGGPFGGGGFGGAPVFQASFGPGGFRTTRINTARFRGAQPAADAAPRSVFLQIMPLILLFAFSFISSLPSLFSTPPTPDPPFSLTQTSQFTTQRLTSPLGVPYYVHPPSFTTHPIYATIPEIQRSSPQAGKSSPSLYKFESNVERLYKQIMYDRCETGMRSQNRRIEAEQGIFGIGTDWDKVRKIQQEKVESCEELRRLGVIQ